MTGTSNRTSLEYADERQISLASSQDWCRRFALSKRENFVFTSFFLPKRLRQPFYNVYAYCRIADNLADESESAEAALVRLEDFQIRLEQAFVGDPRGPLFTALSSTIEDFALPIEPFMRLMEAFRQDQRIQRYETYDQLLKYCDCSANPVGEILLRMCDGYCANNVAYSNQICTGLQLVNFAQDVKRDFDAGRIYLPRDVLTTFGVTEAMFSDQTTPEPLRRAVREHCRRTRESFLNGLPLAQHVPRWFSRDVKLFVHSGLSLIDAIERIDCDVLGIRPVVTTKTRVSLVLKALWGQI